MGLSWTDAPREPAQSTRARARSAHPSVDCSGHVEDPRVRPSLGNGDQCMLWVLGRITAVNWNMDRSKYNIEFKAEKKIRGKYHCAYKNTYGNHTVGRGEEGRERPWRTALKGKQQ